MKKLILLSVIFTVFLQCVIAQVPDDYRYVKTWTISNQFGSVDSVSVDTAHINFQNSNAIDSYSIANSYLGNLGSPIESKIYFDRPLRHDFIFGNAYYPYIKTIENAVFYNTKTPFSRLRYLSGGKKFHEEDEIGFLFTANVNKKLNFGTTLDYIFARGQYNKQAVKRFEGSLFGSYTGDRYAATGQISTNTLNNIESGGITDPLYITNPPYGYDPATIPVSFGAQVQNTFKHSQLFYSHDYSIGFERDVKVADTIGKKFVPVTRFAHTLQIDNMSKRYYEQAVQSSYYKDTYLPYAFTNDTVSYQSISNLLSVSLAEEFNKWMQFGLRAYIANELYFYNFKPDTVMAHEFETTTKFGGVLSKEKGEKFTYNVNGELYFVGRKAGDFLLSSNLASSFRLWKDTIALRAQAFVRSDAPSFFMNNYQSNHFIWNNDFDKTYKTHISGTFAIPTRRFALELAVENVSKQIYFDSLAMPTQYDGNIQIVSANLKQDIHFGKFALENNIVYQVSSDKEAIPLPMLSLYHNLYFHDKWFKVLSVQFGVDLRYHTEYYAPAYMPATGQFHLQQKQLVGNYPVMSAYANFHLKRTRFFAQYYHLNQLFMNGLYYSIPNYPINPAIFKLGLTWNFYD